MVVRMKVGSQFKLNITASDSFCSVHCVYTTLHLCLLAILLGSPDMVHFYSKKKNQTKKNTKNTTLLHLIQIICGL